SSQMALTNPIPLMHLWGRWVGPAEKPVPGVAAGTSSVRFTMSPSCLGQGGGQPPSWLVQGGGSAGPLLAQNPAKPRTGVDAPFRGFSVYAAQTSAPNTSSLGFSKIPEAPRRKFTFNRMISYCPDHSGFPSPPPRTHRRARPQTDEVAGVGHHRLMALDDHAVWPSSTKRSSRANNRTTSARRSPVARSPKT